VLDDSRRAYNPMRRIPQALVDKVVGLRGRLHIYDDLDPASTALVVIDLDVVPTSDQSAMKEDSPRGRGLAARKLGGARRGAHQRLAPGAELGGGDLVVGAE
jgi:hypothetical protein